MSDRRRWPRQHVTLNPKFSDLPWFPPANVKNMTDDDIDFTCDRAYVKDLLDDIVELVAFRRVGRPRFWPIAFTADLNLLAEEYQALRHPPDPAGELLAAWKKNGPGLRQQSEATTPNK